MEYFQCLVPVCNIVFNSRSELQNHYEREHTEPIVDKAKEEYVKSVVPDDLIKKIVPDEEFMTQNTKDLEEMLKALPLNALYTGEEEFQKDFDDILNKDIEDEDVMPKGRFNVTNTNTNLSLKDHCKPKISLFMTSSFTAANLQS